MDDFEQLPPMPRRRRALAIVLGIVTAALIMAGLLFQPGRKPRPAPPPPADAARCKPGQTSGCVGGTAAVIVVPPAAAASSGR